MSFGPFSSTQRDAIILRSLNVSPSLIPSTWSTSHSTLTPTPQPALIHARVLPRSGFPVSAQLDLLDSDTVSYATIASAFTEHINSTQSTYLRLEGLIEDLAKIALWDCGCEEIDLAIELTNGLLQGSSTGLVISRNRSDYNLQSNHHSNSTHKPQLKEKLTSASAKEDRLILKDLRLSCIIGVLDQERLEEQSVVVNIVCWPTRLAGTDYELQSTESHIDMGIGLRAIAAATTSYVKKSSFFTVEALATSLADTLLSLQHPTPTSVDESSRNAIEKVNVRIEKPSAIPFAQGAGVEVTRWGSLRPHQVNKLTSERNVKRAAWDLALTPQIGSRSLTSSSSSSHQSGNSNHVVYLGLGSNMGDRLQNISSALDRLCQPLESGGANATLLDTSFMYESEPMYVVNQSQFLNAACKISTPLEPFPLLNVLKSIEKSYGRDLDTNQRNGPRPLDLDILMFNSDMINTESLKIPHIGIPSRQFVLKPLNDIATHILHPQHRVTIGSLLSRLTKSEPSTVNRIHPIHSGIHSQSPTLELSKCTHLMSILNCTPDSFSDGGFAFQSTDAIQAALNQLKNGTDIIDIGGMSTRPGADEVSTEEEIRRTVPVIRALRETHEVKSHISIDTFKADVARAAVEAGATIVNDVSGGQADPDMLPTVAKLGVPIVLMHMRGDPKTMSSMIDYGEDVLQGVKEELEERVSKALQIGIKRWNILLDPGLGFAKDIKGNCILIDRLSELTQEGLLKHFPILVGPSRKKFLSDLMVRKSDGSHDSKSERIIPPQDRLFGTAAACVMSMMGGARVLRVHDTKEIKEVIKVVDGIRRSRTQ
ncbi:Dihydropteroate synthase-like protein [Melampsora americana]|nr:Dihydropteroate synthase-like protein [Melampsora americana]